MQDNAKKYHRIKNWLLLAQIILSLAGLLVLLFSGLSLYIKDKILLAWQNNFIVIAVYIFILDISSFLLSFPLNFYEGYYLEHKFNLSAQKFCAWLRDVLKKQIIEFIVLLISVEALYLFLRKTADNWWLYAAIFWIFLSIVLAKLTPSLLLPLFFKSSPVKEDNLKQAILDLVEKAGSKIKNIFIIDFSKKTKKSNAMVCGLGKDRRILLADNLVNEFDKNEVCAVVAHELGHEVCKDTVRLIIVASIFSFIAFFACDVFLRATLGVFRFKEIYDIAAFPLIGVSLFCIGLLISPLQNAYARRRERLADEFALGLTQDAAGFISMMQKLAAKNLADMAPNKAIEFLLYSHPSINKRIDCARKFNTHDERRKYTRLDTVLPVEFQINHLDKSGVNNILAWQQGFTQDVARGGICLKANFIKTDVAGLDLDKIRVFLNIHLPAKNPVSAQARIAWARRLPDHPDSYIFGLSFEAIREPERRLIVDFARWRILLPRFIAGLTIILLAVTVIIYTYNLRLRIQNQRLIDNLSGISHDFSEAMKDSMSLNIEKAALGKGLDFARGKIDQLGRELSEMQISRDNEGAGYFKEMIEQDTAKMMQLGILKLEIEKLYKDKLTLENKLADLAKKQVAADSLVSISRQKKLSMEKETISKMYGWVKARQDPRTGLIASFIGDDKIDDWAFTYDQSLAAIIFTVSGDYERARKIFDFYASTPSKDGAFFNAYYASGGEASEYIIHSGPNIWLGIALLQYINKTGDRTYLPQADRIARWLVKLEKEDPEGGIRGGPEVSWYATEHNLDAYAFFDMLYKITSKADYLKVRDRIFNWLNTHSYHKNGVPIWRGKGDSIIATDTYFWSIAAIGPEKLMSVDMDPDKIIEFAENNCYIESEFNKSDSEKIKVSGFDFAKKRHLPRGGIVSSEFSAQVVVSYKIMSQYYRSRNDAAKAVFYDNKARDLLNELEKMLILSSSASGQSFPCLPYASAENADTGHGWFTPQGKQTGSLSGTIYTIFGYYGFNPLQLNSAQAAINENPKS